MPSHTARLLTSLTLAAAAAACTPMSQIANGTAPWAPPSMQTPLPELTRQNRLAADPDTALDPLYPRPGYT